MVQIRIVRSISEIDRQAWEVLANEDVMVSYGWLKTVEETAREKKDSQFFLAEKDGKLCGVAVATFCRKSSTDLNVDNILFGRFRKIMKKFGLSFLPILEGSHIRSYGKHFLIDPKADRATREEIMRELLAAFEREARIRHSSQCFSRVMDEEDDFKTLLRKSGYCKTRDYPITYLDIVWPSFDDYKNHIGKFSRNMKANISKEVNRNRKTGVVIRELTATEITKYTKRLHELLDRNYRKHNQNPLPFEENFVSRLKTNLGDEVVIYGAFKMSKISGVGIGLKRRGIFYLPMAGIDYDISENDRTYFNITIYRPIKDAISQKIRRFYLGNAQYELKTRRGAKLAKCFIFYKPRHAIWKLLINPWFLFHTYWHRKKHASYERIVDKMYHD